MSYKLFNERIASAIENHKDRSDWASIEDDQFMREVFSGSYNEKNLGQLKAFIKRHNQRFVWKEEGTSFWVKNKKGTEKSAISRRNKKAKKRSFCKCIVEKVVALLRRLFSSKTNETKSKEQPKPASRSFSSQREGRSRERKTVRRDEKPKGKTSQKNNKCGNSVDILPAGKRQSEENAKSLPGNSAKPSVRRKESSRSLDCIDKEKENKRQGKPRRAIRLSEFASFSPYSAYIEQCEKLIPTLSESLFTTSLAGDFDQLKINLPVYLSQVFSLRSVQQEVVTSKDCAVFHTGLYDGNGNAVYMSFRTPASSDATDSERMTRRFVFDQFVVENCGEAYDELCRAFSVLPSFISPLQSCEVVAGQLFFDASIEVQPIDSELFLINNLFYLPEPWLDELPILEGYKEKLATLKGKKRVEEMKRLAREVLKDSITAKRLIEAVEKALANGLRKLRRNPRMAVPAVNVATKEIFLLLPLALEENEEKMSVMLELHLVKNAYRCHSLSSLSKAMLAIRTLSSLPDSWLQHALSEKKLHTTFRNTL